MNSLTARVSTIAALVLAVFVALTALTLDRAFRHSAETTTRERLVAQIYLLMADAELDGDGRLRMPAEPREIRLGLPGSGLYAEIRDEENALLWRSQSAVGIELPAIEGSAVPSFRRAANGYHIADQRVRWEFDTSERLLSFAVFEDFRPFEAQLAEYRASLWFWLGIMALLLLSAQAVALTWGLRPLRTATREIAAIEAGEQEGLQHVYPRELRGLTENLNALLARERTRQTRYRNALGDLAHSLKTPLAVLRTLDPCGNDASRIVEEQVARMDAIVQRQLVNAAAGGPPVLAVPVSVEAVVDRLLAGLGKVYHGREITAVKTISRGASFRGSEGDLMELLGNLLDNAFKWCRTWISISACHEDGVLVLTVGDDGNGIAPDDADRILQRGVRLDETTPGHGIGLAVVHELAAVYGGEMRIGRSDRGGAEIRINLPGY